MSARVLGTSVLVLLCGCGTPSMPDAGNGEDAGNIGFKVMARAEEGMVPFKPVEGGYEVPFTLSGGISQLRGPVRANVVLIDQPQATKSLSVVADPDGGFKVDFTLVAASTGTRVAQAEIGGLITYSEPFIVPTGEASFGWVEAIDGGLSGCVDQKGSAGTLEIRVGSADAGTELMFVDGTCSGPGPTRSARFTLPGATVPLIVLDPAVIPSIRPASFTRPASAPRLIVPEKPESPFLPDAGEPFLFGFRVERDDAGLPWTAYTLSWAPATDGSIQNLSGTTDGNGQARHLLVAPTVNRLEVLVTSGSAAREFSFTR